MAVFYNKTMEEIQEARSTLLKKENEIEELRKMMEKEKKSLKYKIIEEMNDQQNQDIKKLKNQHYKEMERYAKLNDHLD